MNRRSAANQRGVGLVEVLAAGFVLFVGLVTVSEMMLAAIAINSMSRDQAQLSGLAQDRLEMLRMQGYSGITAGGDLESAQPSYNERIDIDQDGRDDFHVMWRVDDAVPITPSKAIWVRVHPLRGLSQVDNRKRPVTFVTYIASRSGT